MKICVIIPYFGKLPDHFELWYEACAKNKNIDWILITDVSRNFNPVENIKIINRSISWVNDLIKNKIGNKFEINTPYKLCDYKPLYGTLFEELIEGYDYWGYCDMDLIFGDIESFFSPELIKQYDTLQIWGHFTLLKNDPDFLSEIKNELKNNFQLEKVLDSKIVWAIDEYALPAINKKLGKKIYINYGIIADIIPYKKHLHVYSDSNKKFVFKYENGKVIGFNLDESGKIESNEYMYIHFQKRSLLMNCKNNTSEYYITEEEFTDEKINIKEKLLASNDLLQGVSLSFKKSTKTFEKILVLLKEKNLLSSLRYRRTSRKVAGSKMIKLKN